MLSTPASFFKTKRSHSEIKAELLPAYFKIWAEGIASEELVLADLNAGTGFETDGKKTAVIKILEQFPETENATETEPKSLKTFLGDASRTILEKLKQSLEIPAEEDVTLPENIFFLNEPVNQETLGELLQKVPALLAADPFSYPLAQEILLKALQNSGTGLFLLFDYKKLEKAFLTGNDTDFLPQLFGENFPEIKAKYQTEKSAPRREKLLVESLENSFAGQGFQTVSFRINAPGKASGGAYLLLASKSKTVYLQAKELLQTYSDLQEDGVPLFGANLNYQPAAIPGFSTFLNKYSLENLTSELAGSKSQYHYQTIRHVYETHSPGTHYIRKNYLTAFRNLQAAGTVNLVDSNNKKVVKITPDAVVFYRLHTAAKARK
jgi:three-Cys-motif partner protein